MSHNSSFIDELLVTVASGHGGPGVVSFRREKYVPKGGPDGGDGGRGGDALFKVRSNLKTLTHLRANAVYKAQNGFPAAGKKRHGRDGSDVVILLPPGTRVVDAKTNELLIDLVEGTPDTTFLRGGIGGKGNIHFANSRNQAPRFAQSGMPGEVRKIRLELSLIADIGFVGYPNVGKSSLLAVLSHAHPKIADYPFTTKIPNLGVLRRYDRDIILADIPGIIDGASKGAGLGDRFLKHINRSAALLFLIDLNDQQDPSTTLEKLKQELYNFNPELLNRPSRIIATKMDILEVKQRLNEFRDSVAEEVIPVSSATQEGIRELIDHLFNLCAEKQSERPVVPDYYSFNPDDE